MSATAEATATATEVKAKKTLPPPGPAIQEAKLYFIPGQAGGPFVVDPEILNSDDVIRTALEALQDSKPRYKVGSMLTIKQGSIGVLSRISRNRATVHAASEAYLRGINHDFVQVIDSRAAELRKKRAEQAEKKLKEQYDDKGLPRPPKRLPGQTKAAAAAAALAATGQADDEDEEIVADEE